MGLKLRIIEFLGVKIYSFVVHCLEWKSNSLFFFKVRIEILLLKSWLGIKLKTIVFLRVGIDSYGVHCFGPKSNSGPQFFLGLQSKPCICLGWQSESGPVTYLGLGFAVFLDGNQTQDRCFS